MTWTGRECAGAACPGLPPPTPRLRNQPEPTSSPWAPRARAGPKPSLKEPLLAHV